MNTETGEENIKYSKKSYEKLSSTSFQPVCPSKGNKFIGLFYTTKILAQVSHSWINHLIRHYNYEKYVQPHWSELQAQI